MAFVTASNVVEYVTEIRAMCARNAHPNPGITAIYKDCLSLFLSHSSAEREALVSRLSPLDKAVVMSDVRDLAAERAKTGLVPPPRSARAGGGSGSGKASRVIVIDEPSVAGHARCYVAPALQCVSDEWPSDIDPSRREDHLSRGDFERLFHMPHSKWLTVPAWKRNELKRSLCLF
jgi:hypothetical protein